MALTPEEIALQEEEEKKRLEEQLYAEGMEKPQTPQYQYGKLAESAQGMATGGGMGLGKGLQRTEMAVSPGAGVKFDQMPDFNSWLGEQLGLSKAEQEQMMGAEIKTGWQAGPGNKAAGTWVSPKTGYNAPLNMRGSMRREDPPEDMQAAFAEDVTNFQKGILGREYWQEKGTFDTPRGDQKPEWSTEQAPYLHIPYEEGKGYNDEIAPDIMTGATFMDPKLSTYRVFQQLGPEKTMEFLSTAQKTSDLDQIMAGVPLMGQQPVDIANMSTEDAIKYARKIGQNPDSTLGNIIKTGLPIAMSALAMMTGNPFFIGAMTTMLNKQQGASWTDALKKGVIAGGTSYVGGQLFNSGGQPMNALGGGAEAMGMQGAFGAQAGQFASQAFQAGSGLTGLKGTFSTAGKVAENPYVKGGLAAGKIGYGTYQGMEGIAMEQQAMNQAYSAQGQQAATSTGQYNTAVEEEGIALSGRQGELLANRRQAMEERGLNSLASSQEDIV